jgi:hypothetical protein
VDLLWWLESHEILHFLGFFVIISRKLTLKKIFSSIALDTDHNVWYSYIFLWQRVQFLTTNCLRQTYVNALLLRALFILTWFIGFPWLLLLLLLQVKFGQCLGKKVGKNLFGLQAKTYKIRNMFPACHEVQLFCVENSASLLGHEKQHPLTEVKPLYKKHCKTFLWSFIYSTPGKAVSTVTK